MAIKIINNGINNTVNIPADLLARGNGAIVLNGDNNSIFVAPSDYNFGGHFQLDGGASIQIGARINAPQLFVYAVRGAALKIGSDAGCSGLVRMLMHEAGNLTIGDGCLLASDTDITISDMHSIIDLSTNQRINQARDIVIEKRVWVGQRSMILKGAHIGEGSVIGAQSTVSGQIPAYCAAAGSPARVIRQNITWDHRLL